MILHLLLPVRPALPVVVPIYAIANCSRSGDWAARISRILARPWFNCPYPVEEFGYRIPGAFVGERHVFKPASERIVAADGQVVDAERRVDRRRNVFVLRRAVLRPLWL